jgi:hypothetical protein
VGEGGSERYDFQINKSRLFILLGSDDVLPYLGKALKLSLGL